MFWNATEGIPSSGVCRERLSESVPLSETSGEGRAAHAPRPLPHGRVQHGSALLWAVGEREGERGRNSLGAAFPPLPFLSLSPKAFRRLRCPQQLGFGGEGVALRSL